MNNELQHYGVIGMKWGVRKARKYASIAKSQRQSAKDWESDSSIPSHVRKQNAALDRKTAAKYEKKAAAVNKSLAKTKSNLKKYNKAYNEAGRAMDKADRAEARMKEAYVATGRNRIERVLNNAYYAKHR